MHTEPTPNPARAVPSWLSRLEGAAQRLWRRHIDNNPPSGKSWTPFVLVALILTSAVVALVTMGLEGLAHVLAGGEGWLRADPAGLVADPVRAYITQHTVDVGVDAHTVWWTWCAAGVVFFLLAVGGNVGGRIGWALHGAATTAIVFTGTPGQGRPIATALTVLFWTVLSVLAYRRSASELHVVVQRPDVQLAVDIADRVAR